MSLCWSDVLGGIVVGAIYDSECQGLSRGVECCAQVKCCPCRGRARVPFPKGRDPPGSVPVWQHSPLHAPLPASVTVPGDRMSGRKLSFLSVPLGHSCEHLCLRHGDTLTEEGVLIKEEMELWENGVPGSDAEG